MGKSTFLAGAGAETGTSAELPEMSWYANCDSSLFNPKQVGVFHIQNGHEKVMLTDWMHIHLLNIKLNIFLIDYIIQPRTCVSI